MSVALIWAEAHGHVIGSEGTIPWHLPEDLAHFKALTGTGSAVVVMGRRTWDSLPERFRPLPGRRNIVITRQLEWSAPGAEVVHSIDEALDGADDAWVIGGGDIYRQALPFAARLEVTEVDLDVAGETLAPAVDGSWLRTVDPESGWHHSRTGTAYRFLSYTRPPG